MIDVEEFVYDTTAPRIQSNFKLGIIKNNNKVQFDGEDTPSSKEYKKLNNVTLSKNDRVLLAYVNGTYIILGKI